MMHSINFEIFHETLTSIPAKYKASCQIGDQWYMSYGETREMATKALLDRLQYEYRDVTPGFVELPAPKDTSLRDTLVLVALFLGCVGLLGFMTWVILEITK